MTNTHFGASPGSSVEVPLPLDSPFVDKFDTEIISVCKDGEKYRIDCIPWFTRGLNYGDVIEVSTRNNELYFERVLERSGHATFRILIHPTKVMDPNTRQLDPVFVKLSESLGKFGCMFEDCDVRLTSIDVPPSATIDVRAFVQDLLAVGAEAGLLHWEEGTFAE